MTMSNGTSAPSHQQGLTLDGLRALVFSARNGIFLTAVLAMNFTLMRPSPVDLLYILSFLVGLGYLTLFQTLEVTRRFVAFFLVLSVWAVSYITASFPHIGEDNVIFELFAKTFSIAIGFIGAFVAMSWKRKHFETFMKVYIISCVIASILGTIGFLTQSELLTWDGRAKGLIDDPNMYGSFLIPAIMFCLYLMTNSKVSKLFLLGCMAFVLMGILLSFSRIAVVATVFCLMIYVTVQNRGNPARLIMIFFGTVFAGAALFAIASVASPEFTVKLLDRLTFAKSYDLGEQGRYQRYLLVIPMILQDPIGVGVLQLEKIFPEPIHNIWLSSFVNYGWGGGISYVVLAIGSLFITVSNGIKTKSEIPLVLFLSLLGIILCSTLHEGEHWRHAWLMYGLVWGLYAPHFAVKQSRFKRATAFPR